MTAEFGPIKSDVSDSGVSWVLAGKLIEWFVDGLSNFQDNTLRFSPARNRLSLHGESDCPGHQLRAGALVGMIPILILLIELLVVGVVGVASSAAVGTVLSIPLFLLFLAVSGIASLSMNGLGERIQNMEFFDHTTMKHDGDRLADLQASYVDGELDRDEFEAEVKRVVEQEGQ